MHLGWKLLIPLILFWLMFISLKELRAAYDWNWLVTYGSAILALAVGTALLLAALRAGDRVYREELEDA